MIPKTRTFQSNLPYFIGGLLALVIIWGYTLYQVRQDQATELAERQTQAANLAGLFEQHTSRILRYADTYVRTVRREYSATGSLDRVRELIAEAPLDRSILSHVTIIGADGVPIFLSNRAKIKPGTHARDRGYFKFQESTPGDKVYISAPKRGRNSGKVTVRLVRRMENDQGQFQGVIFAAISVESLTQFFEDLDLPHGVLLKLVGTDKIVRAHSMFDQIDPAVEAGRDTMLWSRIDTGQTSGSFDEPYSLDDEWRAFAFRAVADFSLYAVAGVRCGDIFGLQSHLRRPDFYAAAAISGIMIVILLLMRTRMQVSQARLQSIFDTAADVILSVETTGRIKSMNPSGERVFGYKTDEVVDNWLEFLIPDFRGADDVPAIQALRAGLERDREVRGRAKDGREIPLLISVGEAAAGADSFFTVVLHDMTEIKQAGDQLKASEDRFREFAEVASDWFWEMDEQLRFSYFSDRFTPITGVPQENLLGKTRQETGIPDVDPQQWHDHLDNLANRRAFRDFIHPRVMPDGSTVWLAISGKPYYRDDGSFAGFRGTGSDITKTIETESELIQARDAAELASQAKSSFLSSMSHEMRTPMNAILGFAQLLEADTDNPLSERQRRSLDYILKSGNHLFDLINDVLELNKIDTEDVELTNEEIDFNRLFQESVALVNQQAKEANIAVENLALTRDLPSFRSDRARLQQLLIILLSNAIKYNQEGGQVRLDLTQLDPGTIRISVSDTGHGIPEADQDKLFMPFERLAWQSGTIGGTGIGLTIAQRVIELLGGQIDFESRQGEGSKFWIDIPTMPPPEESDIGGESAQATATPAVNEEASSEVIEDRLILYIEDNPANLELISAVIDQMSGIKMISSEDAESGIESARRHCPDLILLDINLPGMNGVEAIQELRKFSETGNIPVIAVSAEAMAFQIKAAMQAGFDEYITKPVNVEKLKATINRFLDRA